MEAGTEGLLIEKTRPSRIPPLDAAVVERAVDLTLREPPHRRETPTVLPGLGGQHGCTVEAGLEFISTAGPKPKVHCHPGAAALPEGRREDDQRLVGPVQQG